MTVDSYFLNGCKFSVELLGLGSYVRLSVANRLASEPIHEIFRWFFLAITFPDVLQIGINIALFSFLGFLLYERLTSSVKGKAAKSRRNIRKIAKYYLASTFLLFLAYCLGYARGNPWFIMAFGDMAFGAFALRLLEGFAAFLGFVTLVAPLYSLSKMLILETTIGEVSLPELNDTMVAAVLSTGYLALFWAYTTQPQTMLARIIELSLAVGLVGQIGFMVSTLRKRRKRVRILWYLLLMCPWVAVPTLNVLHGLGLI
jgi:hypothetical protein